MISIKIFTEINLSFLCSLYKLDIRYLFHVDNEWFGMYSVLRK